MKKTVVAVLAVILLGGWGLLCAVWGVVTLSRGDVLTFLTMLGACAFCLGLVAFLIRTKSQMLTARAFFDGTGTTIRPDLLGQLMVLASILGGVTAMGLLAVFYPLDKLDIPVGHEQRLSLPIMGAVGAVMGMPLLWRTFRHGGLSYLRLTPTGFLFDQGSPLQGEWAEVKDVTDQPPGKPASGAREIVMVMADGQAPTLAAGSFTPDGRALRELVRFYWQHPELRFELTNGEAIERLRSEQFEVK